jgi:hypothetical protein
MILILLMILLMIFPDSDACDKIRSEIMIRSRK